MNKSDEWKTKVIDMSSYQWFLYAKQLFDAGRPDLVKKGVELRTNSKTYKKYYLVGGGR